MGEPALLLSALGKDGILTAPDWLIKVRKDRWKD